MQFELMNNYTVSTMMRTLQHKLYSTIGATAPVFRLCAPIEMSYSELNHSLRQYVSIGNL